MPMFLTRFSYTPETWARLREQPEDRSEAARESMEAVGGKLHGFWYALGEFDGVTLWEAPSRVSLASALVAVAATGVMSKLETAVLLSTDEAMEALNQSAGVQYRAPGATVRTPGEVA
ncbi:MAG: GYD domain-containing protein [Chloroflexota bacterium]|nr:GYD domain-containing protein [Chloroflexota bacterium]